MTQDLIEFWGRADLTGPSYLHPEDAAWLEGLNKRSKNTAVVQSDYKNFIQSRLYGSHQATALHSALVPQPYQGDLLNAKVVILLLNPGLSALDYYLEENHPRFVRDAKATVRQTRKPHLFLTTEWAWTGGYHWWERKLRDVTIVLSKHTYGGNYGRALDQMSHEIACLELVPYHSETFGASIEFPSAKAAKKAAREIALDRNRTVIITRGVKHWAIPDGPNVVNYSPGQARGASLSRNSAGGRAILQRLGVAQSN